MKRFVPKTLKSRPVIATVSIIVTAVLVAGSMAGALPGRRTVENNDLRTGSVTSRIIKNDTIRSVDISDGTITAADLSGALQDAIDEGLGLERVSDDMTFGGAWPNGTVVSFTTSCPAGKTVISVGYDTTNLFTVVDSFINGAGQGQVQLINLTGGTVGAGVNAAGQMIVMCANDS